MSFVKGEPITWPFDHIGSFRSQWGHGYQKDGSPDNKVHEANMGPTWV